MKCEKCGAELKENASFCEECGAPVEKKEEDIVLESEEEVKTEEQAEESSEPESAEAVTEETTAEEAQPQESEAPEASEEAKTEPETEAEPVTAPEEAKTESPAEPAAAPAAPANPAPAAAAPKANPAPAKKPAAAKPNGDKNNSMIFIIAIAAAVVLLILLVVGIFVVKKIRYNLKVNSATASLQDGDYSKAIEGYLAAVDINDDRAEAYIGLGNTYLADGDYNSAIAEYEVAQTKDKKNTEIADLRYEALKLKYKSENQIDLNRYVSVYFSGYDTVGKGNVEFDYRDMISYNRVYFDAKASIGPDAREDIVSLSEKELRNLFKEVTYTLSQSEGLQNGDEVKLTWNIPEKLKTLQDQALFTIKADEKTYTVSGLQDIKIVDPFENLEVTFKGNSGNGTVRISSGEQGVKYKADKTKDLKNGDKIKITVTDKDGSDFSPEKLINSRGVKLSVTEKEYTVDGLSIYVNSIDEIGKDTLAKIDKQAVDVALTYTSRDKVDINSYKVIGHYLATSKTGENSPVNRLYCLVSYTVTDTENGPMEIIYGVSFKDLMVLNNEVVVNLDQSSTHANSISIKPKSGWSFSVSGYSDIGSFVADVLAKIAKNYEYTTDISVGQ